MEILDSYLLWDPNLGELSEHSDNDNMYNTHVTDLLCDLSQEALLDQLLSDPFLSGRCDAMDVDQELSPICSPLPHIQTEHSYSLSGESRPQSPLSYQTAEKNSKPGESDNEEWSVDKEVEALKIKMEPLLSDSTSLLPTLSLTLTAEAITTATLPHPLQGDESSSPQIKLKPHEVDQFLNFSTEGIETLQMPPTPPSSHGSDTEGSQSPMHSCALASPLQSPTILKVTPRSAVSLSNSPLLTAPHKLQGSGPLLLTEEERRTLIAEGYPVPTKLPLSKSEEKALKKIRRKIKNKISAQESRRKKKEYMDALEQKVETCSNENNELRRKVETLESTNKSLLQQLHSLQSMVAGKLPRPCRMASTQTSTCLMVIVLCFAVFLGSFYQGLNPCAPITKPALSRELTVQESYTSTVKSRNLLELKEHEAREEPRPSGLGGSYPEWITQASVMDEWRLEQQQKQAQVTETHPPFALNNRTNTQNSLAIDLHGHRSLKPQSNKSPKVIELERTVNEPS